MRVYLKSRRSDQQSFQMFVTPAADDPSNSEWLHPDGTHRQMIITFVDGCADVPSGIGRYLIDKNMVGKSPGLIRPSCHEFS
jgi:hypothetical protein